MHQITFIPLFYVFSNDLQPNRLGIYTHYYSGALPNVSGFIAKKQERQ